MAIVLPSRDRLSTYLKLIRYLSGMRNSMSRTLVTFLLATVCVVLLGVVGVGFVGGGLSGVGGGCVGVSGGGDVGELVGFARGGGDVGRWDGLLGRLRAGQDDPVYAAGVVDGVRICMWEESLQLI